MAVPYTFGTATASIPLSNLDANFATTITLGNTAVQLGNTVTTLNNMTLANVTVSSGNVTFTNVSATTANVTTANIGTAIITGTTTLTNLTASTALSLDASKNIASVTNTGTGSNVLSASPTLTGTVAGASLSLSSLTSGRVPFATTAGLLTDSANLLYSGTDLTVYGLTVGRGGGAVATNTAVGASALQANTTASNNTAVGYQAAYANTTGTRNNFLGTQAGYGTTTGNDNLFVGYQAGYTNSTGTGNLGVGNATGYFLTSGTNNTFIGGGTSYGAGYFVTTGSKNVIIGGFGGNSGGLDIRTANNNIVLSDGDGNVRGMFDSTGTFILGDTTTGAFFDAKISSFSATLPGVSGKTSGGATMPAIISWNTATTGDNKFVEFVTETSATSRASITYNRAGGLVAYNVTSDYRAKNIIGPVVGSGALIDSTPVYIGKMKDATQERPMFIAHETPAYAHTGEKDAVDADGNPVYQQMDASALIPVMWAELQSLRIRIAALESTQP